MENKLMRLNRLQVLLIADVDAQSQHSAVEGLFRSWPEQGVFCTKLFFDRCLKKPVEKDDRILLPHVYKRRGLIRILRRMDVFKRCHVVVVRNLFSALSQIQQAQWSGCIGFWESFPHSRRRLEQALLENRAVLRKRLEYYFKSRKERAMIEKCDFYLPISRMHKRVYYPDLRIPFFPTPMGFDFDRYPPAQRRMAEGPLRFVHIGAIDALRRFDIINNAFSSQKKEFILDYYSSHENETVETIKQLGDHRIRFRGALPRPMLFSEIATADVGICFFPHTQTHITASPTKTVEYGALGLPVLVNSMPDYHRLLDGGCAFMCEFKEESIHQKVKEILSKDRLFLAAMGSRLQSRIKQQRDYKVLARQLFAFIGAQVGKK